MTADKTSNSFESKIDRVCTTIKEKPEFQWTINQLAEIAGLKKSNFTLQFRALTGKTPIAFLRECRMEMASTLLEDGRIGIEEVANRVGYESVSAFHTSFKRWSGQPPGAYRRKQLKVPRIKFANRFQDKDQ